MNTQDIAEKLDSLTRYELQDVGRAYMPAQDLRPEPWGEWVKLEDVAALFGCTLEHESYGKVESP